MNKLFSILFAWLIVSFAGQAMAAPPRLHLLDCVETVVDYNLELAQMASRYNWVNPKYRYFTAPPREEGKVKKWLCWATFDQNIPLEEAWDKLEVGGEFLVGDLWELYAVEKASTSLTPEFPIMALHSIWPNLDGQVYVPLIHGRQPNRRLDLFDYEGRCFPFSRFLVVHTKIEPPELP